MLCKAPADVREAGRLASWEEYSVLKQEGTIERVTSWDDDEEFKAMHAALLELGFTPNQRAAFYLMVAIVLQLGNLAFEPIDVPAPEGGGSIEGAAVRDEAQLDVVANLLQVRLSDGRTRAPRVARYSPPRHVVCAGGHGSALACADGRLCFWLLLIASDCSWMRLIASDCV